MQAYRAAQKAGDSLSMLRATVELAKLTGLDKPNQEAALLDRVKGQRRMDQLHKQLESMTESELLKLADLPDGALPDALH